MADCLADIQKEPRFWQRLITFAGYDLGKVDGIIGVKTRAAAAKWAEYASDEYINDTRPILIPSVTHNAPSAYAHVHGRLISHIDTYRDTYLRDIFTHETKAILRAREEKME